jgi:hypothetical protein
LAVTISYVSSANLTRWFKGVTTLKSPALTTNKASPMHDPYIVLALMNFNVKVRSR